VTGGDEVDSFQLIEGNSDKLINGNVLVAVNCSLLDKLLSSPNEGYVFVGIVLSLHQV